MKALNTSVFFGILFVGASMLPAQAQDYSLDSRASCNSYSAKKHCLSSCTRSMVSFDQNIIQIDDTENETSKFLRKTVCSNTGTVSYEEVLFDHHSGIFVAKSSDEKTSSKPSSCKIQCLGAGQTLIRAGEIRT
jgi:hypothetical protein